MRVYLVRHGEAMAKDADPERHLSPDGAEAVRRVGALLKPLGLRVGALWHSPKTRAAETAGILTSAVAADEGPSERDDLAPNDDTGPVRRDLRKADADVMIVGHLPFLARLASRLLADDESAVSLHFAAGSVACLARDDHGDWRLEWLIAPGLLNAGAAP